MLLTDTDIRRYCESPVYCAEWGPMISPFSEAVSGGGVIGYGLSSCGYDIRLGNMVACLKGSFGEVIDPKQFKEEGYREKVMDFREYKPGDRVIVPANGYILGTSLEYFRIPKTVVGQCLGKSTYARCALHINVTPLEPQWEGNLTIEIGNSGPAPVAVYIGEGIAQLQFHTLTGRPERTYKEKNAGLPGKYQGQQGLTLAKVL